MENSSHLTAERSKYYSMPLIRSSHNPYVYKYHLCATRFSLTAREEKQTSYYCCCQNAEPLLFLSFFFFLSLLRSWSISLNIHVARYYWHFSPALIAVGICCQIRWEEGGSKVVAYLCQTADRISSNQIHLEMLIKNYANNWYKNKWKVLKNNFHIWFSDK